MLVWALQEHQNIRYHLGRRRPHRDEVYRGTEHVPSGLRQPQGAVALPIEDASEAAAASQAGEPGSVELQPQIAEGRLVVSDGTSMVATGAGAPSDSIADAAGTEPAVEIPEGQAIYRPQREFVQSMMSPQV